MDEGDAVYGIEGDAACDDCFLPLDDEQRPKNRKKPSKMHWTPKMEAVVVSPDDAAGEQAPWHQDPVMRSVQVSLWVSRSNCPQVQQELPCWEMWPSMK